MPDLKGSQQRRAEGRRRRRGANGGVQQVQTPSEDGGVDLGTAAKQAAAAAAVGAGLAAVRALSARSPERQTSPTERQHEDEDVNADDVSRAPEGASAVEGPVEPAADEPAAEAPSRSVPPPPPKPARPPQVPGAELGDVQRVVAAAREQLETLQERTIESVSGVERTPDGWTVTLEVVELARVPESTDVLASYELVLDSARNLVRYSRGRRYNRSQADEAPSE